MSQLGLTMSDDDTGARSARRRRRVQARRRRRRFRSFIAVLFSLSVVVGLVVAAIWGGQTLLGQLLRPAPDYPGPGSGEVVVQIQPGDDGGTIGRRLEEAGVVKSQRAFVDAAKDEPRARSIQPGSYLLRREMRAADALVLLLDPKSRMLTQAAVPEGLRLTLAINQLSKDSGLPVTEFEAALAEPAELGLPPYANGNAEGFLFPATYEIEPDTTARGLLRLMVSRFNQAAEQIGLEQGAQSLGRTPYEVLTVASLVEAEVHRAEDRPKVARVIYNRLAKGMPLQFDSTVNYATGKAGLTNTREDRKNPSPYNTYVHKGLPPGPINSPGVEALQAALNPADGPWLYFVTVNPDTGETKFAATLEEHQRYQAEFQAWLRAKG